MIEFQLFRDTKCFFFKFFCLSNLKQREKEMEKVIRTFFLNFWLARILWLFQGVFFNICSQLCKRIEKNLNDNFWWVLIYLDCCKDNNFFKSANFWPFVIDTLNDLSEAARIDRFRAVQSKWSVRNEIHKETQVQYNDFNSEVVTDSKFFEGEGRRFTFRRIKTIKTKTPVFTTRTLHIFTAELIGRIKLS